MVKEKLQKGRQTYITTTAEGDEIYNTKNLEEHLTDVVLELGARSNSRFLPKGHVFDTRTMQRNPRWHIEVSIG